MKRCILVLVYSFFFIPFVAQAQQVYTKRNGIIVLKNDSVLRAMSYFTGKPEEGTWYADAINAYQKAMGDNIQVYNMIIPISSAFYWPEDYTEVKTNSQRATIANMYEHIDNKVKKN